MSTLLNQHLSTRDDKMTVAIEHELFGAIDDVDHALPNDSNEDRVASKNSIVDMFKGCACCALLNDMQVASDQLPMTEKRLVDTNIIESICLTDAVPLAKKLLPELGPEDACSAYDIVTVVDAVHIGQQFPDNERAGVEIEAEEQYIPPDADEELLSETDRAPRREHIEATTAYTRDHEHIDASSSSVCLEVENPLVNGHRHPFLSPIWARSECPIAIGFVEPWIKSLMHEMGHSIFRFRGVLHAKGSDKKFVVQGDPKCFQGMFTNKWASNEKRESKFVFIGRNLPRAKFEEELLHLSAMELRFAVGARVMAQVGTFRSGTVVKQWDDGNAYRIRLDRKGGDVFAPLDNNDYVHAMELRFAVGSKVLANVGEFKLGTVIKHWDEGNAYRIRLDETGVEVWGPIDIDGYIKAACQL